MSPSLEHPSRRFRPTISIPHFPHDMPMQLLSQRNPLPFQRIPCSLLYSPSFDPSSLCQAPSPNKITVRSLTESDTIESRSFPIINSTVKCVLYASSRTSSNMKKQDQNTTSDDLKNLNAWNEIKNGSNDENQNKREIEKCYKQNKDDNIGKLKKCDDEVMNNYEEKHTCCKNPSTEHSISVVSSSNFNRNERTETGKENGYVDEINKVYENNESGGKPGTKRTDESTDEMFNHIAEEKQKFCGHATNLSTILISHAKPPRFPKLC